MSDELSLEAKVQYYQDQLGTILNLLRIDFNEEMVIDGTKLWRETYSLYEADGKINLYALSRANMSLREFYTAMSDYKLDLETRN